MDLRFQHGRVTAPARTPNVPHLQPGTAALAGTSALTTSKWTLLSAMVDMSDADSANWRLAICVDANGDGTLDEADPLEYFASPLDPTKIVGSFGTFTVGDVNSDNFPLFVDTVDYYLPVSSDVNDWTLY